MAQVRRELGEDAIIVSTWNEEGGTVRVTAACERDEPRSETAVQAARTGPDPREAVRQILIYHGVPLELSTRLMRIAETVDGDGADIVLAAALDQEFRFAPAASWSPGRPVILVGPNGMGKTVTIAKLAARQVMEGRPVSIISTDTARAAGIDQLAAFITILGLELAAAETPKAVRTAVAQCSADGLILIDSAGVNPFDEGDMAGLGELAAAARAEPVLVLAAGIDPLESADVAAAFGALKPSRLMTTRVDTVRRLGSILAAADAGGLTFGEVGVTPHIADGLVTLNPVSFARLLDRDPLRLDRNPSLTEAAE